MGSPVRRHTNPITRCWDQPHYRYAGTDDGRGTDQRLDTKRLTLMMGFAVRWPAGSIRRTTTPGAGVMTCTTRDGVSAIAITLLVLDLAVPAVSGGHLLTALGDQWPSYLAYIVSFASVRSM